MFHVFLKESYFFPAFKSQFKILLFVLFVPTYNTDISMYKDMHMKVHAVLYEKYLFHVVFSFPFTLVNEGFSMFALLVPSLTSLV